MDLDSRPVVYYSGEPASASIVEKYCTSSLTAQPIEWSRNPSLVTYTVHVDPTFMPLDTVSSSPTNKNRRSKFAPPAAYVFICPNDIQYYTSHGKADLERWFEFLSTKKVDDSLIVTISNKDKKVPAKSSVIYKLKVDFMIDATDRLVDVPTDFHSSSGAWQSLLTKMRNLILRALGSKLDAAENTAKSLLASHSEPDWDFMDFLDCQEEIATLYSCLNLSEEALQCLDKADDWLTSSLAQAGEGEQSAWVRRLVKNPCTVLVQTPNLVSSFPDPQRAQRVRERTANLFELRTHILSRQCGLLQALDRIPLLPKLGVRVVHLAVKEARVLKIEVQPTQVHFWTFICCLEILETFRRSVPIHQKLDLANNLRRRFLLSSRSIDAGSLLTSGKQPTYGTDSSASLTGQGSSLLFDSADDDLTSGISCFSETSTNSFTPSLYTPFENPQLLDDVNSGPMAEDSSIHLLAMAVQASVIADEQAGVGRKVSHHQTIVGTSLWTVELWRRACVSLSLLGRLLDIWPSSSHTAEGRKSSATNANRLLLLMLHSESGPQIDPDESTATELFRSSISKGLVGAKLAVAISSPESFYQTYRKVANVTVFFLWASKRRRMSVLTSLDLADFFRDAGMFVQSEALYHWATKAFLRYSWPELATYSLLQEAFCQQVQWRTERTDSQDFSVFRRYVQSALILSVTPQTNLQCCYRQLESTGPYFLNLVHPSTQPADVIFPAWWPDDWWQESLAAVAEHHARRSAGQLGKKSASLLSPHPPLSVHSLRPLFRVVSIDLKDANPTTHRQCILLQLNVSGSRRFYASVRVDGQPVTYADWTTRPLATTVQNGHVDSKFFSVDICKTAEVKEQKVSRAEAVVRRMFSRVASPTQPKPSRYRPAHSPQSSTAHNGSTAEVVRVPGRPISMEFLDLSRVDSSERCYRLPSDASHLGLAVGSDSQDSHSTIMNCPTPDSAVSGGTPFWSKFDRLRKKAASVLSFETPDQVSSNITSGNRVSLTDEFLLDGAADFRVRRLGTSSAECRLSAGSSQDSSDFLDKPFILRPGDNFLLLESALPGFFLPRLVHVSVYASSPDDASCVPSPNWQPTFIFSSGIVPDQFSRSWSHTELLDRLLPRIESILCLSPLDQSKLAKSTDCRSVNAVVGVRQPLFLTLRTGTLALPRGSNNSNDDGGNGESSVCLLLLSGEPSVSGSESSPTASISGSNGTQNTARPNNMDTVPLVQLPYEVSPTLTKDATTFAPDTLLCSRRCLFLRPSSAAEKFGLCLPFGRTIPLHLNEVKPFEFSASVTRFQNRLVLINLRISVPEVVCPGTGRVDQPDSQSNPLYAVQLLTLRLTAPKLTMHILDNEFRRTPNRSASVSSYHTSDVLSAISPNECSFDNSSHFSFNETDETSEPVVTMLEAALFDQDYKEAMISPLHPHTLVWTVNLHQFESLMRPTGKPNTIGVSARFSFLASSLFDLESGSKITYNCTLVCQTQPTQPPPPPPSLGPLARFKARKF
ncbi:Trafficking protein particle complex subunit 10 [Sparganum proliferum]